MLLLKLKSFGLALLKREELRVFAVAFVPLGVGYMSAYVNRYVNSLELTAPNNKRPSSSKIELKVTAS